jgi:hypothetical protein
MATEILVVNVEPKFYAGSSPRRIISYNGNTLNLTEEERDQVVAELPPYWHTEKDQMVRFIVFEENGQKSYYCERQKEVFNYTHRDYEKKLYQFNPETPEEGKALYLFFVEKYTKIKIDRANNIYNEILDGVKDLSYIKYSLLNSRDIMLKSSDYLMLPDYPIDEETKQMWAEYRQKLRDLTEQEAWITNDLMNIVMPVGPDPMSQLAILESNFTEVFDVPVGLMEDVISFVREKLDKQEIEVILEQISSLTVKYEILKSLSKMKLPFLETNYNLGETVSEVGNLYDKLLEEINTSYIELSNSEEMKTELDSSIQKIENMIQNINENLQRYDIGFTVNDILNSIIESQKLTEADLIAQEIIEDL